MSVNLVEFNEGLILPTRDEKSMELLLGFFSLLGTGQRTIEAGGGCDVKDTHYRLRVIDEGDKSIGIVYEGSQDTGKRITMTSPTFVFSQPCNYDYGGEGGVGLIVKGMASIK